MTKAEKTKPVILLSPPHEENNDHHYYDKLPSPTPSTSSFSRLTRKLSNLSLRSTPPSPRPGAITTGTAAITSASDFLMLPSDEIPIINSNILTSPTMSSQIFLPPSPSFSACSTPTSERAQPAVILQDKYKDHKKGKTIGRGATAKLRLLAPVNGKVVAIKTFRKRDQKDESRKGYDKRMTSEFCISKTLCHRHVIQVFDLLKDKKGRWCTVMEYVSSSSTSMMHKKMRKEYTYFVNT